MANYDMDPAHLRTHELNYELRIRNVATDRVDVTLRRKFLRRELKKDMQRPGMKYSTPNFDLELEEKELKDSISSITELINDYDGVNIELGNRIRSRINHILGRLCRIPENINEEVSNFRGDNIVIVSALEEDLNDAIERYKRGEEAGRAIAGNVNSSDILSKSVSVYKWAIKFSGRSNGESLHSFLHRVEELRIARRCSKLELFEAASDLFENQALEWFRAQLRRNRFDSWDSLVTALKKDFLSSEYDNELWKQIEKRTQHENEPVIIYISIMENLFDCLSEKPTEKRILNMLKCRVLPQYQSHLALRPIESIKDLVDTCRILEESEQKKMLYQPPPRKTISTLEPGLAYGSCQESEPSTSSTLDLRDRRKSQSRSFQPAQGEGHKAKGAISRGGDGMQTAMVCWKCNVAGHLQRDCHKQRRSLVCHGCGRRDVIRPNCPVCSKNGGKGRGN